MSDAADGSSLMLERDEELQLAVSALRAAEQGTGSIIFVEGPAGIGKSTLLSAIQRRAQHRRLTCLWASAGEREQDLEWSVVRSLIAAAMEQLSDASRADLEGGPARLVMALGGQSGFTDVPIDQGALLYALYWLVTKLAAEAPLLLSIDDVHWADEASLRWLEYLGARVRKIGVVLAVGRRSDAAPIQLQALAAHPWSCLLRPAPLSGSACAQILASALTSEPEPPFVEVCCELTAGNPFLLDALVRWLRTQRVHPDRDQILRLTEARPKEVESWAMLQLQGLPPPAFEVARATAILGSQATLGRVSALAGVELCDVARTASTLHLVGMLAEDREPPALHRAPFVQMRFTHPLLARAVYESIAPFVRTALHTEAARLLQRDNAPPVAVADQLMFTEPGTDTTVVEILRAAAAEAIAAGSPGIAAARLTRALAEPVAASELAAVLHELGRAEAAGALPDALQHLERAYAEARSSATRALIAEDLALALIGHGRLEDSVELVRASLAELHQETGRLEGDGMLRLGALYVTTSSYLGRGSEARAWLVSLGTPPAAATPGARLLLVAYSHQEITSGESAVSAGQLARRAVDGGRLLDDVGPAAPEMWSAVTALIIGCQYTAAEATITAAAAAARTRGSSFGYAMALCFGGLLAYRRGRLSQVITDERQAIALLKGEHVVAIRDYAVAFLTHALIDTGNLKLAASRLEALPLEDAPPLAPYAFAMAARGRLKLIQGDPGGALSDQQRVEALAGMEHLTPAVLSWRSQAALALAALDRRPEAQQLAARDVELAIQSGSAWAQGVALHAAGVIDAGVEGQARLQQAAEHFESLGANAELARVLIELGASSDSADTSRKQAIDWLRRGLDLADRCDASPLAHRAHAALVAYGTRPRRRRLSGAEALTPMERRVADQAAHGLTNREIAQTLFLSLRTVESHLTSTYRKLQITSRTNLANALLDDRLATEHLSNARSDLAQHDSGG